MVGVNLDLSFYRLFVAFLLRRRGVEEKGGGSGFSAFAVFLVLLCRTSLFLPLASSLLLKMYSSIPGGLVFGLNCSDL
jgi:hypothetical protein